MLARMFGVATAARENNSPQQPALAFARGRVTVNRTATEAQKKNAALASGQYDRARRIISNGFLAQVGTSEVAQLAPPLKAAGGRRRRIPPQTSETQASRAKIVECRRSTRQKGRKLGLTVQFRVQFLDVSATIIREGADGISRARQLLGMARCQRIWPAGFDGSMSAAAPARRFSTSRLTARIFGS